MKTPWWFLHKTPLAFLLLPLSFIYYLVSRAVFSWRKMFVYKSHRKVICFGGLLAGGVGKTPIVRQVAKYFDSPVVMRGYKKTAKTGNIGDEAMMLSADGIAVHVGHRKSNVILLNKQDENTPIIMDDGLQNPGIKKDISVLVFNQGLGFGNGFLLPAGPLREPKSHVKNADAILVIKNNQPPKKMFFPDDMPVFYAEAKDVPPYPSGTKLVAFAGIGYPKKFFDSLDNVVARRSFPDHYQYTDKDIEQLLDLAKRKNAKLVTTEKDWVRLSPDMRKKIKFSKLNLNIEKKFFVWLKERVNANN